MGIDLLLPSRKSTIRAIYSFFSELFKQIQDFVGGKLMFLGMRFGVSRFQTDSCLFRPIFQPGNSPRPRRVTRRSRVKTCCSVMMWRNTLQLGWIWVMHADAGFSAMNMNPSFDPEKGVKVFFGFRDPLVCGCRRVQL